MAKGFGSHFPITTITCLQRLDSSEETFWIFFIFGLGNDVFGGTDFSMAHAIFTPQLPVGRALDEMYSIPTARESNIGVSCILPHCSVAHRMQPASCAIRCTKALFTWFVRLCSLALSLLHLLW
jgi:hypothetical protein